MGSKNKLKRFNENETFKNVIQPTREEVINNFSLKGKWHSFFKNKNPIVLELGCGKGEYTIALARKNPNKNYIGIDIKGARFWRGAKTAIEEGLQNVAFVRTQIELVDFIFGENEVAEIWITFPDPQIKYKRTKHRMTNTSFLKKYHHILNKDGTNDALWAIADDMRARKEVDEFDTYRAAYRWAERNITKKDVIITAKKLERAYHKAKSEGLVGKKKFLSQL